MSVSISSDGKLLATGSEDKTARVTDITTGQIMCIIQHSSWVRSVSISSDGMLLASGSRDKTAQVTDLTTCQTLSVIKHAD